jgi:hypothetical protein
LGRLFAFDERVAIEEHIERVSVITFDWTRKRVGDQGKTRAARAFLASGISVGGNTPVATDEPGAGRLQICEWIDRSENLFTASA